MAQPSHPWVVEYSKSNRSACKACGDKILKDELRFGVYIRTQKFDGLVPAWHHDACFFKKRNISSVDDLEKFDCLKWEDQKRIERHLEGKPDEPGKADDDAAGDDDEADGGGSSSSGGVYAIENAKSSRASCRGCNEKIAKGDVRVSTSENKRSPAWKHAKCFLDSGVWKKPMEDMPGWEDLSAEDQQMVESLIKPEQRSKRKVEVEAEQELTNKKQKQVAENDEEAEKKELSKQLEKQSKAVWSLMNELREHVSTAEMKDMIGLNGGKVPTSENDVRERCADGMMFGPLSPCPQCDGSMIFAGSEYKCTGNVSAYTKCTYTTTELERLKEKWKIPTGSSNKFLRKWNSSQRKTKPSRLLRPQAAKSADRKLEEGESETSLKRLNIVLIGRLEEKTHDQWKEVIEGVGGTVRQGVQTGITIVTTKAECEKENMHIEHGRALRLPVVEEKYLTDCISSGSLLPVTKYLIEANKNPTVMKVKVKGRSAVHEESELQDVGHILEAGRDVYNVTLSQSDLSSGLNSYYILQVIEEDKGSLYHVFRRWGRVGDPSIGGHKLEEFSYKDSAIQNFKSLFEEKTGNAWESRDHFVKKPRKFSPLEIDYGETSEAPQRDLAGKNSKLHPRVANLMKMLFDVETYKAAMLEFEINTAEMPLGKLSKRHIARGFEVLTEIQNILSSGAGDNIRIVDASNRFFTLIPTVNPVIIKDEEVLKTKIQMLEALRDIEIASQFISSGEQDDEADPLDLKYKKLKCDIVPLPHDSDEFNLVKKYLETTHAPTHTEWALEVEDVFEVQREGERDLYMPKKSSMSNHMLLWHGSRTTNFVGILSQGLRIAPPEAPATGYMFGKGLYFADLVSKSAQYCFTSRSNPVGLMLLSEVALGKMNELKRAQYMEKAPAGFNSTKGLGKMMPDPSGSVTMEDGVVVPCGRPVPSRVMSDLQYNEYIVYSTAQVNVRYLLKVQFKYKR